MITSNEFFLLILTTSVAITLGYPLILWKLFGKVVATPPPPKKFLDKQLEPKLLSLHQKSLEKMEQQVRTEVREELRLMAKKHTEMLAQLASPKELKTAAEKYLQETKIALQGIVSRAEALVDEEMSQQLQAARAELENYKKNQTQKIDNEITTLVEKTIYKTLGKGLSLEDHRDLIYESLTEAKEEGFFNAGKT